MVQLELNLPKAKRLKREGMSQAESRREEMLKCLRAHLVIEALARPSNEVTIDTAYVLLVRLGYQEHELGNAAGSIFRDDDWTCTGWQPSERVSNHGRYVRVWRLK